MWKKIRSFIVISFVATLLINITIPSTAMVVAASVNENIYTLKESELQNVEKILDQHNVIKLTPDILEKYENMSLNNTSDFSLQPGDTVGTNAVGPVTAFLVKLAAGVGKGVIEALLVLGIVNAINYMVNGRNGTTTDRSTNVIVSLKTMNSVPFNPNSSSVWVWRGRPNMDTYYVRLAQNSLKEAGYYSGAIDGSFGPASETATMNFQRRRNLGVDGRVGPATWRRIAHN